MNSTEELILKMDFEEYSDKYLSIKKATDSKSKEVDLTNLIANLNKLSTEVSSLKSSELFNSIGALIQEIKEDLEKTKHKNKENSKDQVRPKLNKELER